MNPRYELPQFMRDRWARRDSLAPDEGRLYWHFLLGPDTEIRNAAGRVHKRIGNFPGLHLTPLNWLHMTLMEIGTTKQISCEIVNSAIESAQESLRGIPPIPIQLDALLYHPEAIAISVTASELLPSLRTRLVESTSRAMNLTGTPDRGAWWFPHITVAYSTDHQPIDPIVGALGHSVDKSITRLNEISLVVQWGDERDWNWEIQGKMTLSSAGA